MVVTGFFAQCIEIKEPCRMLYICTDRNLLLVIFHLCMCSFICLSFIATQYQSQAEHIKIKIHNRYKNTALKHPNTPNVVLWLLIVMAQWLRRASQRHEMYCHDLEVMGSNPGWVELGVHGTSV